jgi:hypothetical protein
MLGPFKRLFSRNAGARDLSEIEAWARRRGHGFKRVRAEDGFVVDGLLEGKPWRIEWGPPQRPYIEGRELRLRMELDLPGDAQMLLLSRPLMDSLERQTFEEFTDNVQTQIGTKTPEEMRWLVMFPKVNLGAWKLLRARFGAVASVPAAGLAWIEGPLAHLLEQATDALLQNDPPFVLMTLRGRAYLRLQLEVPTVAALSAALAIFETAATQASRTSGVAIDVSGDSRRVGSNTAWQSFPAEGLSSPTDKPH